MINIFTSMICADDRPKYLNLHFKHLIIYFCATVVTLAMLWRLINCRIIITLYALRCKTNQRLKQVR